VVLVGVSRTSKTPPRSISPPRHPHRECAAGAGHAIRIKLETLKKTTGVSLHATPERLIQVRPNRL